MNTDEHRLNEIPLGRRTRVSIAPSPHRFLSRLFLLSAVICVYLCFLPAATKGQAQEYEQEVVANLAAGRVVLYVARDAIVIGAVERRVEADSRPPLVLPIDERRVAVLLGAAEWVTPGSGRPPVRLDRELPRLATEAARPTRKPDPDQASDIESIGVALLERIREIAAQLHHKVDLRPDEPLLEVLLIDFLDNYGAEAWLLKYRLIQQNMRGDYWQTRVPRPSYTQLYPPEKGQPRTLVEMRYPPEDSGPTLLELVNQNDPRLASLRAAQVEVARAAEHLTKGDSQKAAPEDAATFMQATLNAVAPPEMRIVLGVLNQRQGFHWILPPPEPPLKAEEGGKPREPGAPTLLKKPPPQ